MSFGGLLGSLYGDLPAPKSSAAEPTASVLPSVPAAGSTSTATSSDSPGPSAAPTAPAIKQSSEEVSWVSDRAALLLLHPVNRKREAAQKSATTAGLGPPAKRARSEDTGAQISDGAIGSALPVNDAKQEAATSQPLVPVPNEYDPSRPNSYDDYIRERARTIRKKEEEARRQEQIERIREEQRKASAAAAPLTANLNVSGEEAWRRRGQITAAMFGGEPSGPAAEGGERRGFAQKMLEKMGWKHGEGLGREKQGITAPLVARKTDKRSGVIVHGIQQPTQPQPKPSASLQLPDHASRIALLTNLVGKGEVDDDLSSETAEEASKYGNLLNVKIVEVATTNDEEAVRIFCEYDTKEAALKAITSFNGRLFGGRIVRASFFDQENYDKGRLS